MSHPMSLENGWQTLVSNALLGTGRQAPSLSMGEPLAGLFTQLETNEPEAKLLSQAAIFTLMRKTATKAERRQPSLPTLPQEDWPVASVIANRLLAMILGGTQPELLGEWLRLAANNQVRVGEEHLPDLLELGTNRKALAEAICAVIGRRGEWLATLNPAWRYASGSGENLTEAWETGVEEQRIRAFGKLRIEDPDLARQLLYKSWKSETPTLRAKVVALLATNLSQADEEFLEAALDDRRKEVRDEAAKLLPRLPQSRLRERITQRLVPLLKVSGLLRKSIEVTLPSECTLTMQRDGISEKVPVQFNKMGERAWWLWQMLAMTPTQLWQHRFNLTPQRLVEVATRSEWSELLLDAWQHAVTLYQETEMAIALADHFSMHNPAQWIHVLEAVPAAYLEEKLKHPLRQRNAVLDGQEPATLLLFNHRRPWSEELSRLFAHALQCTLQLPFNYQAHGWIHGQLAQIAQYIAPTLTTEAIDLKVTRDDWAAMTRPIDEFVATVQFRHEMNKAFTVGGMNSSNLTPPNP
ncbi:MAG: DUF5691 domain-containing protein [Caldilineaceae bacterium]